VPIDVTPHLDPATTAILALECAEGIIGVNSLLPGLAKSAADGGMVEHVAALLDSARRVGVQVFYCVDASRPVTGVKRTDFVPLEMPESITWTRGHGAVVPELEPHDEDIVIGREHGYTAFYTTPLEAYLKKLGTTTLVITGVSLNLGVVGSAIEALNLGYQVIVPSDCVASDPPEYAPTLLRYTVRNAAIVTDSATIAAHWDGLTTS
jgi:nicotinamidase-related amidase